jgi:hypothetical protein
VGDLLSGSFFGFGIESVVSINWAGDNRVDVFFQSFDIILAQSLSLDRMVNIDGDLGGVEHPTPFAAELIGAGDAHGDDGVAELDGHAKHPRIEWTDPAIQGTRAFGEDDQADALVERFFCHLHQLFMSREVAFRRHRDVTEASHHPAIGGDFEMRLVFEPAHELWNSRIDDESIPDIYVITDEETRPVAVEPGGAVDLEVNSCKAQDVPKEPSLRSVISARVDEDGENDQNGADREEVDDAENPNQNRANSVVDFLHKQGLQTMTFNADGKTSSP